MRVARSIPPWLQIVALVAAGMSAVAATSHTLAQLGERAVTVAILVLAVAALERYRAAATKLRALLASMDDVILVLDEEGTYVEIVDTNPDPLYRPPGDLIGQRVSDLFPSQEAEFFLQYIRMALEERRTINVDYTQQMRGNTVWFSAAVSRLNATQVIWVARDITARKLAEEALLRTNEDLEKRAVLLLRENEERFQLLARATNDAVWDHDILANETWRGDGFQALFGYEPAQMPRTESEWLALIHPQDRQHVIDSFRVAFETGQLSWSDEYRFLRADGSYANVLDRGYLVRDAQKRVVRAVGAAMDITERKQLADQLAQARRVSSLGRIAASIAHEFNNVLMGIQPNLEVVRRRAPGDLNEPISHMLHAVRRGKRITDEILRYTRPADPALQCVDVAAFFAGWERETRSVLGPGVRVSIDVAEDIHVAADPHQVAQVVTNLAINARDAMAGRGGELRIAADVARSFGTFDFGVVKTPDQYVHIQISDDGTGMTREQLGHVFEPLFTTKPGGTGLGLAVSYQIVTRHGGKMFAQSEPGRGSTFHILLPAASPLVRIDDAEEDTAPLPVRRILLVEDETCVAAGVQTLLELEGIRVTLVTTGAAALPAIEQHKPDAVVLDIGLPDMDGVDVYRRIAKRWPELPVLFSSGHADPNYLEEYLRKPNVALLVKPYDFDVMMRTLTEVLESGQSLLAAS